MKYPIVSIVFRLNLQINHPNDCTVPLTCPKKTLEQSVIASHMILVRIAPLCAAGWKTRWLLPVVLFATKKRKKSIKSYVVNSTSSIFSGVTIWTISCPFHLKDIGFPWPCSIAKGTCCEWVLLWLRAGFERIVVKQNADD